MHDFLKHWFCYPFSYRLNTATTKSGSSIVLECSISDRCLQNSSPERRRLPFYSYTLAYQPCELFTFNTVVRDTKSLIQLGEGVPRCLSFTILAFKNPFFLHKLHLLRSSHHQTINLHFSCLHSANFPNSLFLHT